MPAKPTENPLIKQIYDALKASGEEGAALVAKFERDARAAHAFKNAITGMRNRLFHPTHVSPPNILTNYPATNINRMLESTIFDKSKRQEVFASIQSVLEQSVKDVKKNGAAKG